MNVTISNLCLKEANSDRCAWEEIEAAAAFNVFCLRLEVFNQVTDSFSVP